MRKLVWLGSAAALLTWLGTPARAQMCAGDCSADGSVVVNELIICVNIALGNANVSTCTACDANQSGDVIINDLITAVNAALNGCNFTPGPTPTVTPGGGGFCGDGAMNVDGETCDDGNNVGGDGCAANCTTETRRETTLDPATSKAVVQFRSLMLPLTLSGTQALTAGRPRNTAVFGPGGQQLFAPGEFPIVVKSADVKFDPIELSSLACACVHGVDVPEFGPGVSGKGVGGCGDQGLMNIDFLVEQDHNTTPGSPKNSGPENGLPDDPECDNTSEIGDGLQSMACQEGQGEACSLPANIHNVCQSPRVVTFSGGQAPRGSVLLINSTAIGLLTNTVQRACVATKNPQGVCSAPDFGPDCLPCTEDDLQKGMQQIAPTTSGTASVLIHDANNTAGLELGLNSTICGGPCVGSVTGEPTDCDRLDDPESGLTGSLVTAFPSLDQQLGDSVVTTTLRAVQ